MSQQQQQQDSRFVMPTEMIMTPKLMDLFKNIDDLMNDYVDYYTTFCHSFALPLESKLAAWNLFQRSEYAKYCSEQEEKKEPVEPYCTLQKAISVKFEDVKANNMNGEERKKAYLRDMKSTSASLKFMQFNYDMQYILLLTHVSKQTKVYSKKVIVSKGGAEEAFSEIENELDGMMSTLNCLSSNNVHA
ncbi:hypothetical protein MUCCIDRAFT_108050 [Mucor lusitanicus CBS 277.49]|uniref:Uncharacterized protein n=1 Tax=Mucor lusitanicus CBS 277.49 TaxID=747725 RepID=A0A162TFN8_MUCCL|nr:hypothetical protein MUCCIDRAFT_108050 [Mucor lusitanicus CBS 277.49]